MNRCLSAGLIHQLQNRTYMGHLAPFIVMIAILITIATIIIALLNYRLKRRIIEAGRIDENIVDRLFKPAGFPQDLLKWGLLLFFGGAGLVVLEFIPYRGDQSPLPYGLEAIFIAIGFLVYYFLVRKEKQQ
jgi:hypothetical protein